MAGSSSALAALIVSLREAEEREILGSQQAIVEQDAERHRKSRPISSVHVAELEQICAEVGLQGGSVGGASATTPSLHSNERGALLVLKLCHDLFYVHAFVFTRH